MSYIGDTPWKKLKKLFAISCKLIKDHGVRYFIYIVKLEYDKQGFSMFSPDEKALDAVSNPLFQEKYTKLLEYFNENYYLVWSQETNRYEEYVQNTPLSEKDKIERFLSKKVYNYFYEYKLEKFH